MIGFLHTAEVHVVTFDALVADRDPAVRTTTVVRPDLLNRARASGLDDPALREGIVDALNELSERGAGVIVCTCSTIAGRAEQIAAATVVPVIRIDRPMAERAVVIGGRIMVLAALESTMAPTESLLHEVAQDSGVDVVIDTRIVAASWERFEAGDSAGYLSLVASACTQAMSDGDVVVLAQASMAGAIDLLDGDAATPVLASPALAVDAALRSIGRNVAPERQH